MKVKVCITITLVLLILSVCESDGFQKKESKESDHGLITKENEESKTKSNKTKIDNLKEPRNSKHKRGILHYGTFGAVKALEWPIQYASVYGYNVQLPPQVGVRGFHSGVNTLTNLPVNGIAVNGITTPYGLGVHAFEEVPPVHELQTIQGEASHKIFPGHIHPGTTHLSGIHKVNGAVPFIQNPWLFKSQGFSHGTPFVLKPGGATISSFNTNYPHHHHHQHIPTSVAFPSASVPVTPVSGTIPIGPATIPVAPAVLPIPIPAAIPVAPTRPASSVLPSISVVTSVGQTPVISSYPANVNIPGLIEVNPAKPTFIIPNKPAIPPSPFFPNIGVLPLQPEQPSHPQSPSGGTSEGGTEYSPIIPTSIPASPTKQPWRPILNPQQPQQPQFPQQPQQPAPTVFTNLLPTPELNRPSITLLPPFVQKPQGGEGLLPERIPSNNQHSQGYHYGVGENIRPNLLEGLTDEEIQAAIMQANFQAKLHLDNSKNKNNFG